MAVLDKLLKVLEDITGRLDQFTSGDYDLSDWRDQMVALHSLQLQAQALIDLGSRLLSNMGDSAQGYRNIPRKLRERGLIDEEDVDFMNKVIGFRNIVIHEYSEVDLEMVEEILNRREYRKLLEIAMKLKERAREYWDP